MDILGFVLLIVLVGVFGLLLLVYRSLQHLANNKELLEEEQAKSLVNEVYGEVAQKIMLQTKGVLEADKEAIFKDNENKRQVIEKMVDQLKQEIETRQKEIRSLEQDRNKKFGEITTAIDEHRKITEELKTSTESLSKVLANNQVRGQWGERIIEDILRSAGFIEDIHYQRQKTLGTSSVIPDITLLLPNQRLVCIDCKFPYAEVQKMSVAETKSAKAEHMKAFARDLKTKIDQIEKRGYINLEHGTLDYAIMFVPNEMLFSFINQQFPEIIDEAIARKVMIVSPFTFLIVARTIMESYRNFMMENNLRQIVKYIQDFIDEWYRFTDDFNKFDGNLLKLREQFDKITTTRYKQMNLRIRRIEEGRSGTQLEIDTSEQPQLT